MPARQVRNGQRVRHQFEDAYWERGDDWNYTEAALKGSSFYKLPRILQWFSGNIGFHHIHHLSPRIPNYDLERCHRSDPLFHGGEPVARPRRPSAKLARNPGSTHRVVKAGGCSGGA